MFGLKSSFLEREGETGTEEPKGMPSPPKGFTEAKGNGVNVGLVVTALGTTRTHTHVIQLSGDWCGVERRTKFNRA